MINLRDRRIIILSAAGGSRDFAFLFFIIPKRRDIENWTSSNNGVSAVERLSLWYFLVYYLLPPKVTQRLISVNRFIILSSVDHVYGSFLTRGYTLSMEIHFLLH